MEKKNVPIFWWPKELNTNDVFGILPGKTVNLIMDEAKLGGAKMLNKESLSCKDLGVGGWQSSPIWKNDAQVKLDGFFPPKVWDEHEKNLWNRLEIWEKTSFDFCFETAGSPNHGTR